MKACAGCDVELARNDARKYCSNACQMRAMQRRLTEEWLRTGTAPHAGTDARHYIRLYLAEQQEGRCAICGQEAVWRGQPLAFVLDHIDGDASNTHRDNLRLVCPNCDSQLPTFKARNRGRGRAWRAERYAAGKSY